MEVEFIYEWLGNTIQCQLHHGLNHVFTNHNSCSWYILMFSLCKMFIIITNIFHLFASFKFTAFVIADNSKIWFTNYCTLLLQYFKLLLKNTLTEFVWRVINLLNFYILLHHCIVKGNIKKLYGPFLWMGFNCLKATTTSRRQFIFYHSVPRNPWYSYWNYWMTL